MSVNFSEVQEGVDGLGQRWNGNGMTLQPMNNC